MGLIWTIIIGFVAGIIAKFIMPGDNEPSGFILTTILGIVGAVVATWLGQALGWYRAGEGAGLIGSVLGAIIILGHLRAFRRVRPFSGLNGKDTPFDLCDASAHMTLTPSAIGMMGRVRVGLSPADPA